MENSMVYTSDSYNDFMDFMQFITTAKDNVVCIDEIESNSEFIMGMDYAISYIIKTISEEPKTLIATRIAIACNRINSDITNIKTGNPTQYLPPIVKPDKDFQLKTTLDGVKVILHMVKNYLETKDPELMNVTEMDIQSFYRFCELVSNGVTKTMIMARTKNLSIDPVLIGEFAFSIINHNITPTNILSAETIIYALNKSYELYVSKKLFARKEEDESEHDASYQYSDSLFYHILHSVYESLHELFMDNELDDPDAYDPEVRFAFGLISKAYLSFIKLKPLDPDEEPEEVENLYYKGLNYAKTVYNSLVFAHTDSDIRKNTGKVIRMMYESTKAFDEDEFLLGIRDFCKFVMIGTTEFPVEQEEVEEGE